MANYGFKDNKTMLLRKRSLPKLLVVQNTTVLCGEKRSEHKNRNSLRQDRMKSDKYQPNRLRQDRMKSDKYQPNRLKAEDT
ncbi:hypothetical protein DPMN_044064 [Dreissena polymorpha]|uniref:Uncharacterized protein n=1 Tax=Dreissena polymorpha TaxID=45954 RepID=A0A9D4I076_DREPO|nr:hypothetical protein DPMN_044064 [Dreissena polymorpha]